MAGVNVKCTHGGTRSLVRLCSVTAVLFFRADDEQTAVVVTRPISKSSDTGYQFYKQDPQFTILRPHGLKMEETKGNLPAFKGIYCLPASVEKKSTAPYLFFISVTNLVYFSAVNNVEKKTQLSDAKRQNALAEKWKTLQNQKFAITNALKVPMFIIYHL